MLKVLRIKTLNTGLAIATIVVAIVLQGCSKSEPKSEALVWGGPKNISMIPIIAAKKGYFKDFGINVRTNYVQTGKVAMDAVVSGDLDFGVIVETNIAFVKFQEGADIKVITSIAEKYDDAIVARRDQGISKPKDLEGKTLAILAGTTSHRFADLFIDFYKLNRSKIEFVNLTPPSIQAAIINDNIPAGSIWQPYRYNVQQELGEKAIQFNDKRIYKAYSLIAVREDFAKKNAEKILAFLKGLVKAEEFIRNHKEEAIAILAKELNIEPNVLNAIWDEYVLTVKLDQSLVQTFSEEGKWIRKTQKGFEQKPLPSYADVLDPRYLRILDPARYVTTAN